MSSLSQDYLTYKSIAAGLTSIAVTVTVINTIRAWRRLAHIDGPPLAPFTYMWLLYKVTLSGKQAERINAVNDEYGPLARVGPSEVVTTDPDVIRRMNGARSAYSRSTWYDAVRMDPYHDSLFSIRDTREHDRLKAKLSFGYGGKENPDIERGVDEQLARLTRLIREKYVSRPQGPGHGVATLRAMDLALKIQYFTLDALTQVAYGNAFGFLDQDTDVHEYIESTAAVLPAMHVCADAPWLRRILMAPWLVSLIGPKETDVKGYGKMIGAAKRVAAQRFGDDAKDKFDMLGSFVRHGVSQRECESEILFQIIAGSDTTATALRGTLLSLITTPQAYIKLQQEIDGAIAAGCVSHIATAEEGRKLPYLQAVIYEGLRIHVPFSGLTMKQVPPEGDTLCGHFVPGGTRVAANLLGIQRRRDVFGEDVEVFRPERWLGLSAEQASYLRQHVELVFGSGRFGCSGKSFAFMELNKTYIELLRHFDFQLINPKKQMTSHNFGIFVESDLWVRVTERNV